jgi:hypothetical protein
VHGVIAAKQVVTDRNHIVEKASSQKQKDDTSHHGDEQFMVLF